MANETVSKKGRGGEIVRSVMLRMDKDCGSKLNSIAVHHGNVAGKPVTLTGTVRKLIEDEYERIKNEAN